MDSSPQTNCHFPILIIYLVNSIYLNSIKKNNSNFFFILFNKGKKGNLEESIGTDTFAKYFQKDLPIRCQKLQQERIIFRTKNKKRSRCFV